MPKLSGIFEQFKNLDQIPIENITRWLKSQPPHTIENFLANRLLYPQVVPISLQDVDIELAILREALVGERSTFATDKKITIPEELINRFPMDKLIEIFIDTFKPLGVVQIMRDQEVIGSFIKLNFGNLNEIEFLIEDKKVKIKKGQLMVVACPAHCHINFKSEKPIIEDKKEGPLEMFGGKIGLIFDGRSD